MDLCGSIVNYAANATDPNAIALRSVLPDGSLVSDFDWTDISPPYCAVSELHWSKINEATNNVGRVEELTVQFTTYNQSRYTVSQILDALETAYLAEVFEAIDHVKQLGTPTVTDRLIYWSREHYYGILNLTYLLNKSPQ